MQFSLILKAMAYFSQFSRFQPGCPESFQKAWFYLILLEFAADGLFYLRLQWFHNDLRRPLARNELSLKGVQKGSKKGPK